MEIIMSNKLKKELSITGTAVYPIEVGQYALIAESDGSTRRTSRVLSVTQEKNGETTFETENTLYHLITKSQPEIAGLMLKKMFEMREQRC